eukprot:5395456-Amphidinium_carterae.1
MARTSWGKNCKIAAERQCSTSRFAIPSLESAPSKKHNQRGGAKARGSPRTGQNAEAPPP